MSMTTTKFSSHPPLRPLFFLSAVCSTCTRVQYLTCQLQLLRLLIITMMMMMRQRMKMTWGGGLTEPLLPLPVCLSACLLVLKKL